MNGFNVALKGLNASQKSLYITSHNISNINNEGYSRQQGLQRATNPFKILGTGFLGTGTEIYDVQRIRDEYVDFKYWNERAPEGEWTVKMDTLHEIEKLFGEPSNSSFRRYLDDFYTALDDMSKNPSDFSYREPVKENALALTKHINGAAVRLQEVRKETEFSIDTRVKNINNIAKQIASLNKQIYSSEISGRKANDLRDKREVLVDELSEIVNVRVHESKEGKYRVNISGVSLVDHTHASEVKLKRNEDTNQIEELQWSNDSKVKLRSGELKGLLELYNGDGKDSSYRGIPYYQRRLDQFAEGFTDKFNELHKQGYGLNSSQKDGDFFKISDPNNPAVTMTVSDNILDDLKNIAAASIKGGDAQDNKNLLKIIKWRDKKEFFNDPQISQGTPDDFLKSIVSNLAVDSKQGQRMYKSQNAILKNIQSKRDSVSGVSYDEEMANMVKFQHAYIASAKMITTMDTIMDVTVNRLGLVGR